jgi:hypothetical protein
MSAVSLGIVLVDIGRDQTLYEAEFFRFFVLT